MKKGWEGAHCLYLFEIRKMLSSLERRMGDSFLERERGGGGGT